MENDIQKLNNDLQELQIKFNRLEDLYFRTNSIDKIVHWNPLYLYGNLFIKDGLSITTGATTGLKIGTAITDKLAFYNSTPIIQQATVTTPSGGATIDSQARSSIGEIKTILTNLGLTA